MQVVREGNTLGYDNPGFESPWSVPRGTGHGIFAPDSLDISSSDGIVCSSSSTPAMLRPHQDMTDSAHQDHSFAPSLTVIFTQHCNVLMLFLFRPHQPVNSTNAISLLLMRMKIPHSVLEINSV